jgi:hypothetical protein
VRITTVRPARQGFSPLDERWRLNGSQYSDALSQQMVWLSGLMDSYRQTQEVFARVGHRHMAHTSLWRCAQEHGERMKAYGEHQQTQTAPERVILPPPGTDHDQRKGVSMDGGMVNILDEGWKEFKAGTVFDVVVQPTLDPQTGEMVDLPCATNTRYTAVLGEVQRFGPALWTLAVEHEVPQAARSSVTADGAAWIWNLAADYFPESAQIVDWYHADEHLATAANTLYPEDHQAAMNWRKDMQKHLFAGHVWRITLALEDAGLADHALYFQTHKRRMQYHEFRENGYPIGSGTVESGIKQYKARLTGPGMRWSRPGAERMLVIRSAVLGDTFDQLWAAA